MTSTEIALLLNNDAEKITRIGEIIGKKIPEKDDFRSLNNCEKTFIYVDVLEHNVTNGGFIQFFFNSSGQFAHEVFHAYMEIKQVHRNIVPKRPKAKTKKYKSTTLHTHGFGPNTTPPSPLQLMHRAIRALPNPTPLSNPTVVNRPELKSKNIQNKTISRNGNPDQVFWRGPPLSQYALMIPRAS